MESFDLPRLLADRPAGHNYLELIRADLQVLLVFAPTETAAATP